MRSGKDRALFAKRLSLLVRAGLPLPACLSILEAQAGSRVERQQFRLIRESVERGRALSESIAEEAGFMNPLAVAVIAVGESSGTLAENLEHLSRELARRAELKAKLIGALLYPAFITAATIALIIGLILFIFPKIVPLFSGLSVSLPLSTRILLSINAFLSEWGIATLALLVALAVGIFFMIRKSALVRFELERALLRVPVVGGIARTYRLAALSRTLSLLLTSGMSISEALPKTAAALGSGVYQRELGRVSALVEEGRDLGSVFAERRGFFPDLLIQMASAGESSGTLAEALAHASLLYESEFEDFTKNLSSLVEPALMITMGGAVGFVAVSMITPLYELTRYLNGG